MRGRKPSTGEIRASTPLLPLFTSQSGERIGKCPSQTFHLEGREKLPPMDRGNYPNVQTTGQTTKREKGKSTFLKRQLCMPLTHQRFPPLGLVSNRGKHYYSLEIPFDESCSRTNSVRTAHLFVGGERGVRGVIFVIL